MRESKDLEFKSQPTKSFLKTVSAFANFGTGTIIFGVNDNGAPIGLKDPAATCLDIENRINDTFDPRPDFTLTIDDQLHTVSLRVEEGFDKPYLCGGKAYRRSDTSTVEVDKLELRRLILEGQNVNFEELPCNNKSLTFSTLEQALKDSVGIESLTDDSMRTLGLLSKNGYNNAAEILADNGTFPGIDAAQFGEDQDIIRDRISVGKVSVLTAFSEAMTFYERHCCYEKITGSIREEIQIIPRKAYREAVANALAHRTWDVSAPVRISSNSDGVEILSPGGLIKGMSTESYINGRYSMLRNPILAEVFFRLGIIEKFGTGIARIKRAYAGTNRAPLFEVADDFICVHLPAIKDESPLTADESLVLDKVPKHQLVSRASIDSATGFEKSKTIRILNALEGRGLIRAKGNARARKYTRL